MRAIPLSLRNELSNDPYYEKCCLSYTGMCLGRIEWHHNLIYAGRQQNKKFCILPLCKYHHIRADLKPIREKLDKIMEDRATPEDLAEYPRRKWHLLP